MTVRVLVAEDQDAVRAGLVLILGGAAGIDVVGEAADGEQAVADHLDHIRANVLLVAPEAETELLTQVQA